MPDYIYEVELLSLQIYCLFICFFDQLQQHQTLR